MQKVTYKNVDYPIKQVTSDRITYNVGNESLESVLLNKGRDSFVDEEAENIDSQIGYYVPDNVLLKTVKEIKYFIINNIDEYF